MVVLRPYSTLTIVVMLVLMATSADTVKSDQKRCGTAQVYLPGGTFQMGSAKGLFKDESPKHRVTLSAFCLAQYETTIADFWAWAQEEKISFNFSNTAEEEAQFNPDYPIREISWVLAERYCRSKGGRLPTEAEWEYAASVDTTKEFEKYPWPSGPEFPLTDEDLFAEEDEFAFLESNSKAAQTDDSPQEEEILYSRIQPVRYSYKGINELYGMLGNVWEWTADWYGPYLEQPMENPNGPKEGLWKTIRGGSYQNVFDPDLMRATLRNRAKPEAEYYHIGFRCAWPVKQ